MVEALTIVLGVGTVRGWRSPLIGVGAATVVLAVLVAALGPALQQIPIDALRLVVGALLLVFGLQWLRKAILRSSGYKAMHDEDEAFRRERAEAEAAGSAQGHLAGAVVGAAAALVVVVVAGVLARGPLERVPENTIKFAVGLLLTSFGCFWSAEGAGADWPGDELSLLALLAFLAAFSWLLVRALRRRRLAYRPAEAGA